MSSVCMSNRKSWRVDINIIEQSSQHCKQNDYAPVTCWICTLVRRHEKQGISTLLTELLHLYSRARSYKFNEATPHLCQWLVAVLPLFFLQIPKKGESKIGAFTFVLEPLQNIQSTRDCRKYKQTFSTLGMSRNHFEIVAPATETDRRWRLWFCL